MLNTPEIIGQRMADLENLRHKVFSPGTGDIYHYTSPEGLSGILQKDGITFWFSRADCMNDPYEGKNLAELLNKVQDTLLRSGQISEEFSNIVKKVELKQQGFITQPASQNSIPVSKLAKYDVYLCCFTQNGNSSYMWKNYCKTDNYQGFNMQLHLPFFWEKRNPEIARFPNKDAKITTARVIYDNSTKESMIYELLILSYQLYTSDPCTSIDSEYLSGILSKWQYLFKDTTWSEEKEIRSILLLPRNPADILRETGHELLYRNNDTIPYVKWNLDRTRLSSIHASPYNYDSENSAIHEIRQNGYSVSVTQAELK